jgi:predicted nucleic acid-binding protein
MRPTSDKVFVDSNVVIYAHTDQDLEKQRIAQKLIGSNQCVISHQVLNEVAKHAFKKVEAILD